jgi:hypothetical protein
MAISMTDQLRSSNNLEASGLTIESVIYVQVRWGWMSLPLFVPLVAVLLLMFTITVSFIDGRPLWKSSGTAMLFHQLTPTGSETEVLRSNLRSLEQLQSLTKRTRTVLVD